MKAQDIQLWVNRHYDEAKHWLIVTLGFILVAFALISYGNQNRLLDQVASLSAQNKQLSQDNKRLNQQNKVLATNTQSVVLQNRSYIRCLSTIFAQYTHDFVPITITNLDGCAIVKDGTSNTSSQGNQAPGVTPSGSSNGSSSTTSASGQNTTQGSSSSNTSTSGTNPQPTFSQCVASKKGLNKVVGLITCL